MRIIVAGFLSGALACAQTVVRAPEPTTLSGPSTAAESTDKKQSPTTVGGVTVTAPAGENSVGTQTPALDGDAAEAYVLGPEDKLTVKVLDLEDISDKDVYRVDMRGNLNLPVVGRMHVSGLTVEQVEFEIQNRLKSIMNDPAVTISIYDFRPHPVSVFGAVKTPGVIQVIGHKTLYEALSLAGGLNPDAGNIIKITRQKKYGNLPLAQAEDDSSGQYSVADLNVRAVMDAQNPEQNIEVLPYDVISVPKADLVYVVGAVKRAGGFVLSEREKISVLQALSMAEGIETMAATGEARILRSVGDTDKRVEIPVDLKKILQGKAEDVSLIANDILFIPVSGPKNAAMRATQTALAMATGVVIYGRY